jgi:hypothetical protein
VPTNPVLASMVVRVPIDVAEELQRRAAAAKMPIEQLASLALRGWLQDRGDAGVVYKSRKTAEELADAVVKQGARFTNRVAIVQVLKQEAAS